MSKEMNVYFVLPSHCEDELSTSEEMQQAFELCRQNQIIPEWISEENSLTTNFNKKDIVVLEKFEGVTFQKIKTRLSVVGPWCIITCLLEGLQVPNNKSPIYNMAMYKLTVTASNYTVEQKKKMKERIEMMGGVFILTITSSVTHLVTNSVRTQKYAVANAKGIDIMLDSWVEDVWNCSLTRNVKATDAQFQKHKCPCFQNLRMCSTGFEIEERNKLQKYIEANGGTYSGKLLTASTDILVCRPGTKSEKYDVARRAKMPCVRIEWIYDSVEKGFALPEEEYVVNNKVSSSTPTKTDAHLNADFSMMSVISGHDNFNDPLKTSVSDTLNASLFNMHTPQNNRNAAQKENQKPDLVAEIDLQAARKAGTFLDGCGVLLAGFSPERRDKLCRILRNAGATRYEALSDRVTQVLVGDPASHEVRLLGGRVPLVSPAWIMESIRRGQPAPEEPYIINTVPETDMPAPSSPLSKKGLTLLQNDTSMAAEPEPPKEQEPEEHESIQLYRNNKTEEDTLAKLLAGAENVNSKCETNKNDITEEEEDEPWHLKFEGKTFRLIGHSVPDTLKLTSLIEDIDGKVVENNFRGITDFAVVPVASGALHQHAAAEIISCIWLIECHECGEYITPQYYHHPVYIANDAQPLEGCIITISGYPGYERNFLIELINALGATYQDRLARVTLADKSVKGSTHLVCSEASGNKWAAAVKWKKLIVTHEWLLKCAETGQRVPEKNYLRVKDSLDEILPAPETPTPVNNKRDFEGKKISPTNATTNDKRDFERRNGTIRTAEKKKKSPEIVAVSNNSANNTNSSVPLSNKRDIEGNRKSPITPPKITENKKTSSVLTPTTNHFNALIDIEKNKKCKPGESPILVLEDGRVESLNTYMNELRAQGLYDTPSPLPPAASDTPVHELLARLRREGKLPSTHNDTPTRNNCDLGGASQGTPVGRYLRGLQERNVLPSSPKQTSGASDSPVPRSFFDVKTPDTPLGRFLGEDDPSRSTRKHWQRYLDRMPHYPLHERPAAPPRRPSTPWSEVKRQAWSWLFREKDGGNESFTAPVETRSDPPELVTESQLEVSNQIGQLRDMLRRRESSGPSRSLLALDGLATSASSDPPSSTTGAKDSQTDTVGWDEPLEDVVFSETSATVSQPRKFMMSAVDQATRINITNIIRSLGGEVSDYKFFDSTATHVVCSNAARNEKILSSMAAGLWVLHSSYVEKSGEAGRFLSEEDYELGNPKSEANIASFVESSPVTEAIHWWRETVRKTGKGAFHGMRALVFAKNTDAIVRLIEAGGGTILRASPPFAHSIDITHCFLDNKFQIDLNEFIPLAEQGVPCLNVLFLSIFLSNRTNVNINEYIIPGLRDYYN